MKFDDLEVTQNYLTSRLVKIYAQLYPELDREVIRSHANAAVVTIDHGLSMALDLQMSGKMIDYAFVYGVKVV